MCSTRTRRSWIVLFERLLDEGRRALEAGDAVAAAATLREALAPEARAGAGRPGALDFAQGETRRLEELRLSALMDRIEADLRSVGQRTWSPSSTRWSRPTRSGSACGGN